MIWPLSRRAGGQEVSSIIIDCNYLFIGRLQFHFVILYVFIGIENLLTNFLVRWQRLFIIFHMHFNIKYNWKRFINKFTSSNKRIKIYINIWTEERRLPSSFLWETKKWSFFMRNKKKMKEKIKLFFYVKNKVNSFYVKNHETNKMNGNCSRTKKKRKWRRFLKQNGGVFLLKMAKCFSCKRLFPSNYPWFP